MVLALVALPSLLLPQPQALVIVGLFNTLGQKMYFDTSFKYHFGQNFKMLTACKYLKLGRFGCFLRLSN